MLIGGALEVGRDSPMMGQALARVNPEHRLIVADVDGDQHEVIGVRSGPLKPRERMRPEAAAKTVRMISERHRLQCIPGPARSVDR